MDKIQAIHFFLKLAETLSFKRTAQHFGVPSSTVSRSLKALEKQLGVELVERTTTSSWFSPSRFRAAGAGRRRRLIFGDDWWWAGQRNFGRLVE